MFLVVKSHLHDGINETIHHYLFKLRGEALSFVPVLIRSAIEKYGYCYDDIDSWRLLEIDEFIDLR